MIQELLPHNQFNVSWSCAPMVADTDREPLNALKLTESVTVLL